MKEKNIGYIPKVNNEEQQTNDIFQMYTQGFETQIPELEQYRIHFLRGIDVRNSTDICLDLEKIYRLNYSDLPEQIQLITKFRKYLENKNTIIYLLKNSTGEIVGFFGINIDRVELGEGTYFVNGANAFGFNMQPDLQSQGIGKKILTYILEHFLKTLAIYADCDVSKRISKNYISLGFVGTNIKTENGKQLMEIKLLSRFQEVFRTKTLTLDEILRLAKENENVIVERYPLGTEISVTCDNTKYLTNWIEQDGFVFLVYEKMINYDEYLESIGSNYQ